MFSKAFALAAAERALKTFAQTLAALLVADGTGLLDSQWVPRLSAAGMAALLSVLTSVASAGVSEPGPSLGTEVLAPAVEAKVAPDSPTGAVAGPGSSIPEDTPVHVDPAQAYDGMGAPISNPEQGV